MLQHPGGSVVTLSEKSCDVNNIIHSHNLLSSQEKCHVTEQHFMTKKLIFRKDHFLVIDVQTKSVTFHRLSPYCLPHVNQKLKTFKSFWQSKTLFGHIVLSLPFFKYFRFPYMSKHKAVLFLCLLSQLRHWQVMNFDLNPSIWSLPS